MDGKNLHNLPEPRAHHSIIYFYNTCEINLISRIIPSEWRSSTTQEIVFDDSPFFYYVNKLRKLHTGLDLF